MTTCTPCGGPAVVVLLFLSRCGTRMLIPACRRCAADLKAKAVHDPKRTVHRRDEVEDLARPGSLRSPGNQPTTLPLQAKVLPRG